MLLHVFTMSLDYLEFLSLALFDVLQPLSYAHIYDVLKFIYMYLSFDAYAVIIWYILVIWCFNNNIVLVNLSLSFGAPIIAIC